jgi:hypothetical protein
MKANEVKGRGKREEDVTEREEERRGEEKRGEVERCRR